MKFARWIIMKGGALEEAARLLGVPVRTLRLRMTEWKETRLPEHRAGMPHFRPMIFLRDGLRSAPDETVMQAYDSPFLGRPVTWFDFDVGVVGKRITMYVNGVKAIDVVDPGNAGVPEYGWAPLANGGWIGVRNFRPDTVWIDSIRVCGRPNRREGGSAR